MIPELFHGTLHYHGEPRAQWIFSSPNYYGAFWTTIAAFCIGCLTQLKFKQRLHAWFLPLILALAYFGALLCVGRSLSRGAIVSVIILLAFGYLITKNRKEFISIFLLSIAELSLIPQLPARCHDAAKGDGASLHRLQLWKAVLESSISGKWSAYSFPDKIWLWFDDGSLIARYRNPICTPLGLIENHGFPIFALVLALWTTLSFATMLAHRPAGLGQGVGLAGIGIALASLSSYIVEDPLIRRVWYIIEGTSTLLVVYSAIVDSHYRRRLPSFLAVGFLVALCSTAAVFGIAWEIRTDDPIGWRPVANRTGSGEITDAFTAGVKDHRRRDLLWVCQDAEIPMYIHSVLDPLARTGVRVEVITYPSGSLNAIPVIYAAIRRIRAGAPISAPIVLGGSPDGISYAFQTLMNVSGDIPKVIAIAPGLDNNWPSIGRAIRKMPARLHSSLFLYADEEGWSDLRHFHVVSVPHLADNRILLNTLKSIFAVRIARGISAYPKSRY